MTRPVTVEVYDGGTGVFSCIRFTTRVRATLADGRGDHAGYVACKSGRYELNPEGTAAELERLRTRLQIKECDL